LQNGPSDVALCSVVKTDRAMLTAQGNLIGTNDLMIAVIARANKAILITHNIGEFSRFEGLEIEDWEA
jgi:tRNA(fMet)-specific endonuclease VapC